MTARMIAYVKRLRVNVYRIWYNDDEPEADRMNTDFSGLYRGYSEQGAIDRFYDSIDSDGWVVTKIEFVKRYRKD